MTITDPVPMSKQQIKAIKILSSMLSETADEIDRIVTRKHPDLVDATWLIRNAQKKVDRALIKLS